ncbi:hypothetical protein Tco_1190039, partial [Tanacetum coccineum]
STEKFYAYASGKFTNVQSTIDAEINACINTLEKLKIYYLDKKEITLRTDCQAIISFYKKTSSISEGEGEFQAGVVIRKEEFMFMVYEEDYEDEKDYEDESDEEEVAFMVRPNFDTPTVTYFPGNNEAIEELRRSAGYMRKILG